MVQNPLIARFKVLAQLDITERRVPQDGRIQVKYLDGTVDLRVSSLPSQHGEKITLRILDSTRGVKTLDELGLTRPICSACASVNGNWRHFLLAVMPAQRAPYLSRTNSER